MALITCQDISLGYEGKTVAEDINFSVNSGDYLCIVGENGSGKSTLMQAVLKLKEPLRGKIIIGDGLKQTEMGYLPQQTGVQRDFPASVKEVVLSGCLNRCGMKPFYTKEIKRLAAENMERLGIGHLQNKCFRELSGGQRQRVLLARALCATGRIILLDEPAAGLDPKAAGDMYELIGRLNRNEGITVVMILHDIRAACEYGSHILHISRRPLFFGTAKEYAASSVGKMFLSVGDSGNG